MNQKMEPGWLVFAELSCEAAVFESHAPKKTTTIRCSSEIGLPGDTEYV